MSGSIPVIRPPSEPIASTHVTVSDVPVSLDISIARGNVTGMAGVLPRESATATGHPSVAGEGGA